MQYTIPKHWLDQPIRVLVLGCGGTGSDVVDTLARLHFSLKALGHPHGLHVTLQDGDTVSASNIGRQRFVPADVGHNKATVLASRYNIAYGLGWRSVAEDHDPSTEIGATDLLITCTDRASVRVGIALAHQVDTPERRYRPGDYHSQLWMDFGNAANSGQAVLGHLWNWNAKVGSRLPNFFDLFPNAGEIKDDDAPSCSAAAALRKQEFGINRMVADAGLFTVLVPLLTKGVIEHHGAFVDMAKGRVTPILIDPATWEFLRASNAPTDQAA
ncbi:PRTRC system ThiF family protein [Sinimarinibacterium sp. CAU 1509]|uniref:PRTRC system ThiF family protein n=1 Tax=Sinimarinibacterium sp. CAU 1509 TaxID=2562283 RepID=UPI0010ACFAA8|nr:PRTRC system ThiF family protein [Sinimarinibacterium sp. CAU 1509]TJY57242.1 PRTRC system ThiF family protein [Sinimarinibacterium sp. CAU 1509]